jgi:predicted acetyltransferase
MNAVEVRRVQDDEFDAWSDAIDVGFHSPHHRGDGPLRRRWIELDRCWGAFDEGRPVGTYRGLTLELTVPGAAAVPVDGISAVTVAASHRRQGLLSRMMAGELAAAKGRGESMAVLIAAEWPIYGRFGFGPATESADWTLDARSAQFSCELPGTVELVDQATARAQAPIVYDRYRRLMHGNIDRAGYRWDQMLNLMLREGKEDPREDLYALCRDDEGNSVGFARYKFGPEHWSNQRPDMKIKVGDLFATDLRYEARLWKFLADHDWVKEVYTESLGPADPLWRELLVDRRAAWLNGLWEGLWLRILDPATALSARIYETAGRIVLRITDKDGYADGAFALEAGANGVATCAPTTEAADLTIPVAVLSSIYLGGFTADRYHRLGRIDEHRDGAAKLLNAMFRTTRPPLNITGF